MPTGISLGRMVPLWAAILVGLASGALGTLLVIGHERGAEIRTRMLDAADDYHQALFEMATGIQGLSLALEAERPSQEVISKLRMQLQDVTDRSVPVRGRIQLLFGGSRTMNALIEVNNAFEGLRLAFDAWEANQPDGKARVEKASDVAGAAIAKFTSSVRRDLRWGVLSRFIDG
jgi:hypothetical protein